MNATLDKAPISLKAAMQLPHGADHLDSIEEALFAISQSIGSPEFAKYVRQMIETGSKIKYSITVKKSNQQGFVVALNSTTEAPTQPLLTFLRLV